MRWSYKTVLYELKKEGLLGSAFLDESEIEQSLNEFGTAGWELVSMIETRDGIMSVFKQPLARLAAHPVEEEADRGGPFAIAGPAAGSGEKTGDPDAGGTGRGKRSAFGYRLDPHRVGFVRKVHDAGCIAHPPPSPALGEGWASAFGPLSRG